MLDQHAVGYSEFAQSMNGLGTPLGGRAWVEQELTRVALLVHRRMAVTEHDHVGIGKSAPHPRGATGRRSTVMEHPDPHAAQLHHPADGQHPHKRNVIVAQYGVDRCKLAQQLEHPLIKDVTSMQDGVRPAKTLPRRLRQSRTNAPDGPRRPQVSVRQDHHSNATGRGRCCHRRQDREPRHWALEGPFLAG